MSESSLISFVYEIVVASIVGGIIGTEREWSKHAAGLRTFTLVTIMGAALTRLEKILDFPYLIIIGLAFISLVSAELYWMKVGKKQLPGLTTSIVLVLAYILGIFIGKGHYLEAISASILVTFFLAAKHLLHRIVRGLTQREIIDAMKFGIASFVLLPLVPEGAIDPWGLLNLRMIWMMAVLVLGIGFASYVAIKAFGESIGLGVTAFFGGMLSSTALTVSMADKARKKESLVRATSLSITLASAVMFLKILLIAYLLYPSIADYLLYPMIISALIGMSATAVNFREMKERVAHHMSFQSPLAFRPALEFALIFSIIAVISAIGSEMFGEGGVYFAALIGGLTQMNSVIVLMASLAESGKITIEVAGKGLIVAALINTVMKAGLSYHLGGKKLGDSVVKNFALMFLGTLGALILLGL